MALLAVSGLAEMNSMFAVVAGVAVLIALIPLMAWAMGRVGHMSHKVWEDHKNEVDMEFYRPRFEERRAAQLEDPRDVARRGRYDLDVEDLLSSRRIAEARALCEQRLAEDGLPIEAQEMYRRYIRVIDEQFSDDGDAGLG